MTEIKTEGSVSVKSGDLNSFLASFPRAHELRIMLHGTRDFDYPEVVGKIVKTITNLREGTPEGVSFIVPATGHGAPTFILNSLAETATDSQNMTIDIDTYPANWTRYGKKASNVRNQEMISTGRPDVCIGFMTETHGRKYGAWQAVKTASRWGVPTWILLDDGEGSIEESKIYVPPLPPSAKKAQQSYFNRMGVGELLKETNNKDS